MKKIVFTFGRFTPPTVGHAKLINKVIDYAKETGAENRIYTSKSFDTSKNPIPYKDKVSFLRQLFPNANVIDDPNAHTAFHVAKILSDEGYRDVTMVVGSDRVQEFKTSIGKYIKDRKDPNFDPKKHYSFDKWTVVSAGERDPDAQGVEGMSGTKMREAVKKGDLKAFASGIPTKNARLVKKIFDTVKKNLKEEATFEPEGELDHKKFAPMLHSFVKFASDKLGIKSTPALDFAAKEMPTSFGGYNPQNQSIVVVTKNRHPMDIFRTVAHELVHHKQKEDGKIGKNIEQEGATGSPQENEANAEAGKIMRWFAKSNPEMFKQGFVVENFQLDEGVNDPGTFKAVFLAGGPGSGKDYVMKQTMEGHGLQEINSDIAFEFLMRKAGLDFKMPEGEREERDVVRGRGKQITKEQQRLAIAGRRGVIINGTADDPEKIVAIKKELEDLGYDTMMVFVDTRDEVSKERNIARGQGGGREVPEDIRKEKWEAAQAAKPALEKVFGKDNFVAIDNSEDIRKAPKEVKEKVLKEFGNVFKKVRRFSVEQPIKNPKAAEWIQGETQRRGITDFRGTRATAFGSQKPAPTAQVQQQEVPPNASEMEQAKRLGLIYLKFGRWGRNIDGQNVVTHISQNGQLVAKPHALAEDLRKWFSKTDPEGGWKRINSKGEAIGPCAREPGEPKPKCMSNEKRAKLSKKERAAAVRAKRKHDPNPERKGEPINVSNFGKGKITKEENMAYLEEKNVPTNPELWSRAKALAKQKFDVYPSAYANGWASKWYKSKGGGWKTQADEAFENFMEEADRTDTYKREWGTTSLADMYKKDTPGQSPVKKKKKLVKDDVAPPLGYEFGNNGIGPTFGVPRSPGLGFGYSLPMNGYTALSESVQNWMMNEKTQQKFIAKYGDLAEQKLMEAAKNLDESLSEKAKNGPKFFSNMRENWEALAGRDMGTVAKQGTKEEMPEDWQKVNRQDKTDGLSQAAVNAYRRENPGSKLQTAVTEKNPKGKRAKRRLSFCRRMKGMKKRLTSAETARDPDSRINKALRRWNCEE